MSPMKNYLAELPVELLLHVCSFLDNTDLLRLGVAWKIFLKTYTPSFDPTNALRQRLKSECRRVKKGIFQRLLSLRYQRSNLDEFWPDAQLPASFFAALFDFGELDRNNSAVKPSRICFAEPTFADISRLLTCRSEVDHVGPKWGRDTLYFSFMWCIPADDDFEYELLNMCGLLRKTDCMMALEISVDDSTMFNNGPQNLWQRAITNIVAAIPLNGPPSAVYITYRHGRNMPIDPEELSTLIRSPMECVYLWGVVLPSVEEMEACWSILAENTKMNQLTITQTTLTYGHVIRLADALRGHGTLKELNLSYAGIGNDGAVALAEILKTNRSLVHVDISQNPIGVRGMTALFGMLKTNGSLQILRFSSTNPDDTASYLRILKKLAVECQWTVQEKHRELGWDMFIRKAGRIISFFLSSENSNAVVRSGYQ